VFEDGMYDETFMRRAIALSARALETPGAHPYGAVVVKDGKVVGEGLNRSAETFDPTSHGEVEAIRDACSKLKTTDLAGAELYTSCEPCPLCVAAMMIAGIGKLYYAASLEQSGALIARGRVPAVSDLRRESALPPDGRRMPSEQRLDREAVAVLEAWAGKYQ
jgi:tRNA(Arg) A34 adenosine deaminase TadA